MKRILIFLIGFCAFFNSFETEAQQYPVYSQYLFNPLVINPAYAGSHVQFSATVMYRNQWVNLDGAPRTTSLSMHSTLGIPSVGVGALITNDKIGSYSNTSIYGSYAYRLKTPTGSLSMGLQAGFNLVSADYSNLNLNDLNDASFISFSNKIRPNFGAGVYYDSKSFYAGFSVPFILNTSVASNLESFITELREARYYFIHGGAFLNLNAAGTAVLHPSVLIRAQEGQPLSADINIDFILNEVFSIGTSYRNVDAIITYMSLKLSDQFHFGYSYDWTQSDLNQFSKGTHEFMLNYRFRIRKFHGNVECPSFYEH
jgi:type IX secretion system PorP/SprF family membrane protein